MHICIRTYIYPCHVCIKLGYHSIRITNTIAVTCVLVFCLICIPSSLGPAALGNSGVHTYISGRTYAHVTIIKCHYYVIENM